MVSLTPASLVNSVRQEAQPLTGKAEDYNPLLDMIGDSPIVLLGEASHGTHEFYRARADITPATHSRKRFQCCGGGGRLAGCLAGKLLRTGSQ